MPYNALLPEWHNQGQTPSDSKKLQGWNPQDRPPAEWMNWFFNTTYEALSEIQAIGSLTEKTDGVIADLFGAVGDANYKGTDGKWYKDSAFTIRATDDYYAIQAALDYALQNNISTVKFLCKRYLVNGRLTWHNGLTLKGSLLNMGKLGVVSTELAHDQDKPFLRSEGTSVLNGIPNSGQRLYNLSFHGADLTSNLIELIACSDIQTKNVMLKANKGAGMYMKEVMDSRFDKLYSDWCGTSDGYRAVIEIESGSGYEYSNELHFENGRIESYRGTALRTIGNNSNELFLSSMKFESLFSNIPHLEFINAAAISLDTVNVCSRGAAGQTIESQVKIVNCGGIKGDLFLEHTGSIGTNAANIKQLVDIQQSSDIDLYVLAYQNGNNISGSSIVNVDTLSDDRAINITGSIRGDNNTKKLCNKTRKGRSHTVIDKTPYTEYKKVDVPGHYFQEGRLDYDGAGIKHQLIHGTPNGETLIYDVLNNDEFHMRTDLFMHNKAFHLAQIATAPYGREGSRYIDTSVTPYAERYYRNGAWRREARISSLDEVSGSWNTGDFLIFNNPPEVGAAGNKYEVTGYRRLTPGSGKVVGTDLRELRNYTGN